MNVMINLKRATISLLCMTLLLGVAYPMLIWGIGRLFFPEHADGSLLRNASKQIIGSKIIGQKFSSPRYFHPRPSQSGEHGYDGRVSQASNLGPTSRELIRIIQERIDAYRLENHLSKTTLIPVDAVTASGSGLDPHISLENAHLQAARVAEARNISAEEIHKAIDEQASGRWLGVFGEKRVNVLLFNLKLDELYP